MYARALGVALSQKIYDTHESSERSALRELLSTMKLDGVLIQANALHTTQAFFDGAWSRGADLLLSVKENQKILCRQIDHQFEGKRRIPFTATDVQTRHGRQTRWDLRAKEAPDPIKANWPGSAWIVQLITTTTRRAKRSLMIHRFMTSVRTTPEALLRLIRQRWSIENEWHWSRDVQLGEDAHRYANRTGAAVFSFLRTVATAPSARAYENWPTTSGECLPWGQAAAQRRALLRGWHPAAGLGLPCLAAADDGEVDPPPPSSGSGEGFGAPKSGKKRAKGDFRGIKLSNETHRSSVDPVALLARKSNAHPALPSYRGHVPMDNRHALIVDCKVTQATGTGERDAAKVMAADRSDAHQKTLGADKNYDTKGTPTGQIG